MTYHPTSVLRGRAGLGTTIEPVPNVRTDGISVPAVTVADVKVYATDYVYPTATAYSQGYAYAPASAVTGSLRKGASVTITAVHGIMAKLASGGWVLNQHLRSVKPTSAPVGAGAPGTSSSGSTLDKALDAVKNLFSASTTPAAPVPGATAPRGAAGLFTTRNVAIGGGALLLLALLLRRNGT